MSVCNKLERTKSERTKLKMEKSKLAKSKYIEKYINTKVDIDKTVPFGFSSSVNKKGEINIYTHGKRSIEKDLPFDSNSIYRIASQSKFMGSVGFLKLVDKGLVSWDEPIKNYLPEYSMENMKVINPYTPSGYNKTLLNPLYTTEGSNTVHVRNNNHPLAEGDCISVEWANGSLDIGKNILPSVNGIPGFEMYNIFEIFNVKSEGYDIKVSTNATKSGITGGYLKIKLVEKGVHRSICLSPDTFYINPRVKTYYYKNLPLTRELTILDVLTHGLGWSYYSCVMLYMSFGYSFNLSKQNIQAGIWNELGIPVGLPLSMYKCGIREWVRLASNVPLLYQPGEDWSYGPQLSILGALIEEIDGRKVENFLRDELWNPLGMNDTGFYIYDEDINYYNKKDRLAELYVNMPKIVFKFMGDDILSKCPHLYEAQTFTYEGPRSLCLIDSGMYTTVSNYLNFMKMLLNEGKTDSGNIILSKSMINIISTFHTCYDVSNLESMPSKSGHELNRKRLLESIKWGLGVGTMQGCKNNQNDKNNQDGKNSNKNENDEERGITWGGILGTRFLIDFCSGIAYNVGTNVVGPPAGTFDTDLIELNYKTMNDNDYNIILTELLL